MQYVQGFNVFKPRSKETPPCSSRWYSDTEARHDRCGLVESGALGLRSRDRRFDSETPVLQLKRFVGGGVGGVGASISKPADPHDLCPHSGADGRTAVYDQQVTARGGDKKRGHARTFPRVRSTWRSPPNTLSNWREPGSRSLGRVKGSSRG